MSSKSLTDLNLHDSVIRGIHIVRGGEDILTVDLEYIDQYDPLVFTNKRLHFVGCVKVRGDINFRVSSPDAIAEGDELASSDLLTDVRERFARSGCILPPTLRHYVIETSTTGSRLDIIAERIELM